MADEIKNFPKLPPVPHVQAPRAVEAHVPSKAFSQATGILKAKPELLDRYTAKVLNTVIKNLKLLITFRTERSFELAAKKDNAKAESAASSFKEGPLVLRDGKLIAEDLQGLSDVVKTDASAGPAAEGKASEGVRSKGAGELSVFEKIFLARFEGGTEIVQKLEGHKARFLSKSDKEWIAFFRKFLPFTFEKKASLSQLETLIYRGLMKGKPNTLVSDIKLMGGKTDKFARLEVGGSDLLKKLDQMAPGDVLTQALVAEWIGGPEFAYQALSHRIVNPGAAGDPLNPLSASYRTPEKEREAAIREGTRSETQGIALSRRTEQLIAERLDLNLNVNRVDSPPDSPLAAMFSKKKKGGLFGGFFEEAADTGPVFVPWYQKVFQPRRWKGKPRWWVTLTYFVTLSALGLAAFYVFKFLLQR